MAIKTATGSTSRNGGGTKVRLVHVCSECGTSHPKWSGQCSGCGDWNTLVEDVEGRPRMLVLPSNRPGPARIGEIGDQEGHPVATDIAELDRVLGGGIVPGSVTLLGGEPGIGKSTLLLQLLASWTGPTLYVTAEESAQQVRRRAERLGACVPTCGCSPKRRCRTSSTAIDEVRPQLVVIDWIQTVHDPASARSPAASVQVRGCAHRLVVEAKERNVAIVLVGHVTKDGGLAGPRVLEHVVDTVLQFEGDRHHALRLLRAVEAPVRSDQRARTVRDGRATGSSACPTRRAVPRRPARRCRRFGGRTDDRRATDRWWSRCRR